MDEIAERAACIKANCEYWDAFSEHSKKDCVKLIRENIDIIENLLRNLE